MTRGRFLAALAAAVAAPFVGFAQSGKTLTPVADHVERIFNEGGELRVGTYQIERTVHLRGNGWIHDSKITVSDTFQHDAVIVIHPEARGEFSRNTVDCRNVKSGVLAHT